MAIRSVALSLIAFCGAAACMPLARGQEKSAESGAPPRPVPTLSQRLEQFRQELLGSNGADEAVPPEDLENPAVGRPVGAQYVSPGPSATRKFGSAQRSLPQRSRLPAPSAQQMAPRAANLPSPSTAQPAATSPTENPPAAAASVARLPDSPVQAPAPASRLQTQSARKAKASNPFATPGAAPAPSDPEIAAPDAFDLPSDESLAEPSPTPAAPEEFTGEPAVEEAPLVARAVPRADVRSTDPIAPEEMEATLTSDSPVLSVEAAGPRTIRVGQQAEFVVKIRNAGAAADNVVVTVDVPAHAEVASARGSTGTVPAADSRNAPGGVEWRIPRLEGQSSETLNLTLVPVKSDPLGLAVRFTYAPAASQLSVEVQEPKLEMAITGPSDVRYGETKVYRLTISNPGNGEAENVVINLLPVGDEGGGTASHKLGNLGAGESRNVEVELTARQAGAITIKAQAYADHGLRSEAAEQVFVRRASLQVGVEAPRVTYAGTAGSYRVIVVNSGDAAANDVQVSAMLPPDAKYLASSAGGQYDAQQGKVTWTVGGLAAGAERALELKCSLSTPGENRMQFVTSAGDNLSASAAATTQVQALADLKIEVRDPQGPVAVGTDAVYEIVVQNRGSAPAHDVDLVAYFSEGLEASSVDGGDHEITTGQVSFTPLATVGAGDTVVYKVRARADREGHHVFRCELYCESLHTKLAAEEATYFYGGEGAASPAGAAAGQSQFKPAEPAPLGSGDDAPPFPE